MEVISMRDEETMKIRKSIRQTSRKLSTSSFHGGDEQADLEEQKLEKK
jgi:hypothetical protein